MNGIIYLITNLINDRQYVGQTSMTLDMRWKKHLSDARCGCDTALYYAMRKYGMQNFQIQEIERCPIADLDDREIYWIQFYDTFDNGYNETLGGQFKRPFFSDKDLNKMHELYNQGYSHLTLSEIFHCTPRTIASHLSAPIERERMGKTVCQVDPDTGKVIGIYPSTVIAGENCDGNIRGHIAEVCDGRALTAGGYYWMFATGAEQIGGIVALPADIKNRLVVRAVYQYTLDHKFVAEYPSLIAAARALGSPTKRKDISEACRGLKKRIDPHHYNGSLWYFD